MPDPELGAKQICPACATKFYDLKRRPAVCPKCATEFDPEEALRSRRIRARVITPEEEPDEIKPEVVAEAEEDGFEAEPEAAPLDEVIDEPVVISDDEEEAEESDPVVTPPVESLGVDFAEEDELEEAEDDEVPFIEDEDDAFPEDEIDGLPSDADREES